MTEKTIEDIEEFTATLNNKVKVKVEEIQEEDHMDFIHGEIHPEDHIHTEEPDDEEEDIPKEDVEDFMTVDFAIKLIYPDDSINNTSNNTEDVNEESVNYDKENMEDEDPKTE